MARKKQEIQLQQVIETQEEWEEMLSREGLTVVDIFQDWCGPCKAMISNFRRIKNELGDDLLKFAVAKADTVDSLEKYRGRCEPCFLFFATGKLVAVQRGANVPSMVKLIPAQLACEKKVLEGSAERKEIKDPLLASMEEKEKAAADEDEKEKDEYDEEPQKKEVTIALIKPDVVADGRVDEVIEQIKAAGIEILAREERRLTEEEARHFYEALEGEEFFDDLITFMCSGPSHVLVLTKGKAGENIIQEWRELIGPTVVEDAQEAHPDSLRAKFGKEKFMNAVHGSDGHESAARELAFFYPDFVVPNVPGSGRKLQRTVALIRPDAVEAHKDEIIEKIKEAGFEIAMMKEITLNKEQAEEFYAEQKDQDHFDELITRMTSGPCWALALAREDAVTAWRDQLGPKEKEVAKTDAPESLRAQFDVPESPFNPLHGSDSHEAVKKEMEILFPMQQTLAVIKPEKYASRDEIIDRIHEAGFKIAQRKETTLSRDVVELMYADQKEKEYFNDLADHMTSGPTLFMVLSREDAVQGFRDLMGPTDPTAAKEQAPDSLRAQYGTDVKANALHASSTADQAKEAIKNVFEKIEEQREEEEEAQKEEEGEQKEGEGEQEEGEKKEGEEEGEKAKSGEGEDGDKPEEEKAEQEDGEQKPAEDGEAEDKKSVHSAKQEEGETPQAEGEKKEEGEGEQKPAEEQPTEDKPAEEEKKEEEQKEEEKKEDEQKEEEKKEDEQKEEEKKEDEQKEEEKKEDEQKEEEKKEDEEKPEGEAAAAEGEKKDDGDAQQKDDDKKDEEEKKE